MNRRLFVWGSVGLAAQSPPHDDLGDKLDAFAKAYNDWVVLYGQGEFDIRRAKRLSSLWKAIEQSGQWPR